MRPFLTVSRRDVVELAAPWDPQRLIDEYLGDAAGTDAPSAQDIRALASGGTLRFDLQHRRLGGVEAELHLLPVSPQRLETELAAALALKWWLWPLALPFRGRIRRLLNRRIDQMLDELAEPPSEIAESGAPGEDGKVPTSDGVRSTLQILTLDGRRIYEHTQGLA